jgi:hypothetical protein
LLHSLVFQEIHFSRSKILSKKSRQAALRGGILFRRYRVKDAWCDTSTRPYTFMDWCLTLYRVNLLFYPMLPGYLKSSALWKVSRLRPFVLSATTTAGLKWVGGIGGMKLTGENGITLRKPCSGASLPTTNLTRTGLGSNTSLHDERPATNRLNHVTAYL